MSGPVAAEFIVKTNPSHQLSATLTVKVESIKSSSSAYQKVSHISTVTTHLLTISLRGNITVRLCHAITFQPPKSRTVTFRNS